MVNSERYPLRKMIISDLLDNNKWVLCLFFAVIITAILTVWVTYSTQQLTIEANKLSKQNRLLENRYVHLQLEENSQSRRERVEEAAKQLGLQPISKEQEAILSIKPR